MIMMFYSDYKLSNINIQHGTYDHCNILYTCLIMYPHCYQGGTMLVNPGHNSSTMFLIRARAELNDREIHGVILLCNSNNLMTCKCINVIHLTQHFHNPNLLIALYVLSHYCIVCADYFVILSLCGPPEVIPLIAPHNTVNQLEISYCDNLIIITRVTSTVKHRSVYMYNLIIKWHSCNFNWYAYVRNMSGMHVELNIVYLIPCYMKNVSGRIMLYMYYIKLLCDFLDTGRPTFTCTRMSTCLCSINTYDIAHYYYLSQNTTYRINFEISIDHG